MPFFEVSCKSNINIEDAFLSLARKIREQRERRVSIKKDLPLMYIFFNFIPICLQGDNFDNDEKQDKKSPGSNGLGTFSLGSFSGDNRCTC